MKHQFIKSITLSFVILLILQSSCKKPPYIADYTNTGGFVIGKEMCKANEVEDYWLIDLTYYPNTIQYGDTLLLNGIKYNNVIKTKGLHQQLKQIGMSVSLDFKTVTTNKVETTGCSVSNPVTYQLKELFIINQGEIR